MTIRFNFAAVYPGFDVYDNWFTRFLKDNFQAEVAENPDYLICFVWGPPPRDFRGITICYTGENVRPDLSTFDYAISFDWLEHPCHFRMPLYRTYFDPLELTRPKDPEQILRSKSRFCNFVVSNGGCQKRNRFFHKLSRYKLVDSGGRYLNNLGAPIGNKRQFLLDYKFTLAFENASYPGYTTEKLAEPMWSNSLPIYWGNPCVERDFNPRSFINLHDFADEDAALEWIIKVDRDDELYMSYFREPYFANNTPPACVTDENIVAFFAKIFQQGKPQRSRLERLQWRLNARIRRLWHGLLRRSA